MHLNEKISKLNTLLQATRLILIFININLQLKLMNQTMLKEILIMKLKDKKHQKKELNCVFIGINPDEKYFNIFKEINKIYRHITQLKEENKTKEQKKKRKKKKKTK